MKVLQINNCHYRRGGADIVYLNMAEMLRKNGHEVVFFSIKDEKNIKTDDEKYFIDKKVEADANLKSKFKNLIHYFYNKQAAKNIERLIEIEKPDIAHIHLIYGGITPSILKILKRKKVPAIHTIHDYRLICPAYTYLNRFGDVCELCGKNSYYLCAINKCSKGNFAESLIMTLEMYFRNIFFNAAKYFDGLIYVSDFSRNKHLHFKPGLQNVRSIVLYNYEKEHINSEIVSKEDYFLYFGRISKEKGLITLLSAFKDLPDKKLKVLGSGPQINDLKKFIEANNLKNVELMGYKFGKELKELISKAYFVVLPSEWYENNPLTIIESYNLGTPVIGSNAGGIPEIIKDEITGYIFESRNPEHLLEKLKKAISLSNESYLDLHKNSLKFANENFNEKKYYTKLINFYSEIIDLKNERTNK